VGLDVERQQHEAVEAGEEEELKEGAPTNAGCATMGAARRNYRMTVDALLRGSVAGAGDARTVTLDPRFAGLPETAHGGSVLGLFALLAGVPAGAVRGVYHRRVPLGVALALRIADAGGEVALALGDGAGGTLVEGRVGAVADPTPVAEPPAGDGAFPLAVSASCFACGTRNDIGLGARFAFDHDHVLATWAPLPRFAAADGTLAAVALTTLLDEAAFWLGALATGEAGMTTELVVTLAAPVPLGVPIRVRGARADTRVHADDPRRWQTRAAALLADGRVAAEARITFIAVRGAARRLVTGMLAMNEPDVLRRIFPAYVP
jgi:hypothetical protein